MTSLPISCGLGIRTSRGTVLVTLFVPLELFFDKCGRDLHQFHLSSSSSCYYCHYYYDDDSCYHYLPQLRNNCYCCHYCHYYCYYLLLPAAATIGTAAGRGGTMSVGIPTFMVKCFCLVFLFLVLVLLFLFLVLFIVLILILILPLFSLSPSLSPISWCYYCFLLLR